METRSGDWKSEEHLLNDALALVQAGASLRKTARETGGRLGIKLDGQDFVGAGGQRSARRTQLEGRIHERPPVQGTDAVVVDR